MAYIQTEKQRAASLANLKKARQAHLEGRVPRPARPPNLKHGYFARDLRKSVILLGEDVREYDAHLERFSKVLAPATDRERCLVRRIAETAWQLIRGYRARANSHSRKLRQELELMELNAPLSTSDTYELAFMLIVLFSDEQYLVACMERMRNQLEWLFRLLIIERTGRDEGFRWHSHVNLSDWDKTAPFE